MDRLDSMEAFVAIADGGSFTGAAKRLKRSAPAVTRQLAALEQHLGVRLLHRTTRSVALSDAGRRYLEKARRILADVAQAHTEVGEARAMPAGRFVVTAPTVFGRLHVVPLFMRFLLRWPKVQGELQLSDAVLNLVESGVDVAVRIGGLTDSTLVATRIGQTRRVWVCAPKYLEGKKRPTSLQDLKSHDFIHLSALSGPPPKAPRLSTNSPDAAIACALKGGGITEVLGYQVAEHVAEGRLQLLLEGSEPPPLPVKLVYPSARQLSVNVRSFVELVQASRDKLTPL